MELSLDDQMRVSGLGTAILQIDRDIGSCRSYAAKKDLLVSRRAFQAELDSILGPSIEPMHRYRRSGGMLSAGNEDG
jgi:hypothetical protein